MWRAQEELRIHKGKFSNQALHPAFDYIQYSYDAVRVDYAWAAGWPCPFIDLCLLACLPRNDKFALITSDCAVQVRRAAMFGLWYFGLGLNEYRHRWVVDLLFSQSHYRYHTLYNFSRREERKRKQKLRLEERHAGAPASNYVCAQSCLFLTREERRKKSEAAVKNENFPREPTGKTFVRLWSCRLTMISCQLCVLSADLSKAFVSRYATRRILFILSAGGRRRKRVHVDTIAHTAERLSAAARLWRDSGVRRFILKLPPTNTDTCTVEAIWIAHIKGLVLARFWFKNSLWKVTHGCYSSHGANLLKVSLLFYFRWNYFQSEFVQLKVSDSPCTRRNRFELFAKWTFSSAERRRLRKVVESRSSEEESWVKLITVRR